MSFRDFLLELSRCPDEAAFLEGLADAYRNLAVGESLDFAEVQRYWRNEAELPLDWRRELAQHVCLGNPDDQADPSYYFEEGNPLRWLMAHDADDSGMLAWERLVVLCAPFTTHRNFRGNWQPQTHDLSSPAAVVRSLEDWAAELAEGRGGWAGYTQWVREAGGDPACLARALAARKEELGEYQVEALTSVRRFIILLREQLLLGAAGRWLDLLDIYRLAMEKGLSDTIRYDGVPDIAHQLTLPLLRELAKSPRLDELLIPTGWEIPPMNQLFCDLDLACVLAETPDAFNALLQRMPERNVVHLRTSALLAKLHPWAVLAVEKRRFALCGEIKRLPPGDEGLAWLREVLPQIRKSRDNSRLCEEVTEYLAPYLSEAEALAMLDDFADYSGVTPSQALVNKLTDIAGLTRLLEARNGLPYYVVHRMFELAAEPREPQKLEGKDSWRRVAPYWEALMQASAAHPQLFISESVEELWSGRDDLSRWELLWRSTAEDCERGRMVQALVLAAYAPQYCSEELFGFFEARYRDDPQVFERYLADHEGYHLELAAPMLVARKGPLAAMVPGMVSRALRVHESSAQLRQALRDALKIHPDALGRMAEADQLRVLPLLGSDAVADCGPALAKLFSGKAKHLRAAVVELISRCSADAIERSGLLAVVAKARKPVLVGMALGQDPALAKLIAAHIDDAGHDEFSRGVSLDALERFGHPLDGLDTWAASELADLQDLARNAKPQAAVDQVWNEEFASLLAPLGEPLGRYLLGLLADGGETLARRARQLLERLPAGKRADFALLCVEQWVAAGGVNTAEWLLMPIATYGDERTANALVKAVKDWKKTYKQRACSAIRRLCTLPGSYGVSQAYDLWENGKFTDSILKAAREALTEVAQAQELSLEEFLEQLVPDFGLQREGLVLDVGPYAYTVRIRPDLSLAVIDEQGKVAKSLPKARDGEDPDKRSLAENQYKALAKNLKPVLRQQVKRLTRALQLASSWPLATWNRLFAENPLMACISQGVVWAADSADGQPLARFRPDESGELIDLDDEVVELPADARVHIAHPLELSDAERVAWIAHFADYKLESPIGQWALAVHAASAEELQADELARARGARLNRAKFGSLLEKWGYTKGAVGDGAVITRHTLTLDGERWRVALDHGDVEVYFEPDDEVDIEAFTVCLRVDGTYVRQSMGELPPALLNTLLDQAETLNAAALD